MRVRKLDKREAVEAEKKALEAQRRANQILDLAHRKARRTIRLGGIGLGGVTAVAAVIAVWTGLYAEQQLRQISLAKLELAGNQVLQEFESKRLGLSEIDTLVEAMKIGQRLKALVRDDEQFATYPVFSPLIALQHIAHNIYEQNRFPSHKNLTSISFSPDGQSLATASYGDIAGLWQLDGTLIQEFKGHTDLVYSVSFSPDGKHLATTSEDGTARLWQRDGTLVQEFKGHTDWVYSISFSPDGQSLATASGDGTARLWQRNGTLIREFKGHTGGVFGVSFSPDGQSLATASGDGTARLWQRNGTLIREFKGHTGGVYGVSFSPDGQYLATASGNQPAGLWRLDRTFLQEFKGHNDWIYSISFSPDGQSLATASRDGTVRLWQRNGALIQEFKGHTSAVFIISFSPDGQSLATASRDSTVRLWQRNGTLIQKFKGHNDRIYSISFSPDGQYLATASGDGTARLWQLDGTTVQEFKGHTGGVYGVSFSPDGQYLATASRDGTARLWQFDGTLVQEFGHTGQVYGVSFSPNGQYLATATGHHAALWQLDGTPVQEFKGHTNWVFSIRFSPDGQYLATASGDGTVRLWQHDGSLIQEFRGHTSWVDDASFSPDGQYLATTSRDGTVRLLPIETLDQLLARGCEWLHDYLAHHPKVLESLTSCQTRQALMEAAPAWIVRAEQLARERDVEQAVIQFKKALQWKPDIDLDPRTETLDQDPEVVAQKLAKVAEGQELAEKGDVEAAITLLKEAQELDPAMDLNPDTAELEQDPEIAARQFTAPAKLTEAQNLAAQGNIEAAITTLKTAQNLDPAIDLNPNTAYLEKDPETTAKQIAAPTRLEEGQNLAKQGEVEAAISAYQLAQELDPGLAISAHAWDSLCRNGSLHGHATNVMFACEKAVTLFPLHDHILDSRGLARALNGDFEEAITDAIAQKALARAYV